jgi:hypothetical protein
MPKNTEKRNTQIFERKLMKILNFSISEVSWRGTDIVVFGEVSVSSPYRPEDVKGREDSKAYIHVKKIVEKHHRDQQKSSKPASSSGSPANVSSAQGDIIKTTAEPQSV